MPTTKIEISTPDGPCAVELAMPEGAGPWPAVVMFYDAGGMRPASTRIAERIAKMGYLVAMPDLFHRSPSLVEFLGGEVTMAAVGKVFADPARKGRFFAEWYGPAVDYANLETTIGALLDHLDGRSDVKHGVVGTTGYCMGGNAAVRAATIFGERITATAAFHPGGLVTDQPDSPHLRADRIEATTYLAPANGDLPPANEAKLRAQLDAGNVRYEIEHYDAGHGYAVDDSNVYTVEAAEKHYAALARLYAATL